MEHIIPNNVHSRSTDEFYLTHYIESIQRVFDNDICHIFDTNSSLRYISKLRKTMWGLPDNYNLENNPLLRTELPNIKDNSLEIINIQKIDDELKKNSKCSYISITNNYPDKYKVIIANIKPITNPSTNNIIGYLNTANVSCLGSIIKIIHNLSGITQIIQKTTKKIKDFDTLNFTQREKEILFLYCLKLSCSEIAEVLSEVHHKHLSVHTVGNIIRGQLFEKIGVNSSKYLIEQIINSNLLNHDIPNSIIPTCLSFIN